MINPSWWLKGAHIQTIWSQKIRHLRVKEEYWQRLELDDGDFLDLVLGPSSPGPVVLIIPGLGGSIDSVYARALLQTCSQQGWQAVVMHCRGNSGEANRLPRFYHAGETEDINVVLTYLQQRFSRPMAAIGVSLGGSMLINWLHKNPQQQVLRCACAVSVPYNLHHAAKRLGTGLSRLYERYLLHSQKWLIREKRQLLQPLVDVSAILRSTSFREFDDRATAPLHGFENVNDYYDQTSPGQYLGTIQTPTLLIHALDDPFMYPSSAPQASSVSAQVQLDLQPHGGHVGFINGRWPWKLDYWLDKRIPSYFKDYL